MTDPRRDSKCTRKPKFTETSRTTAPTTPTKPTNNATHIYAVHIELPLRPMHDGTYNNIKIGSIVAAARFSDSRACDWHAHEPA